MITRILAASLAVLLASCGPTYLVPDGPAPVGAPVAVQPGPVGAARPYAAARADWDRVVARVEPVAETFCREENPGRPPEWCDFQITLIEDPRAPANAYQTIGRDGRPRLIMTRALLADTRSADEIAFVLAHEAGHHVAGHLERQRANVAVGALIFGTLAQAAVGGGDPRSSSIVSDAMDLGAFAGSRVYSQSFELEADTLGAFIAARSGFSPETGSLMFQRMAASGGGNALISTHPPSAQRFANVSRVSQEIRRQQALGQVPRPAQARGRI